jgi:hypothetical protein
MGFFKTHLRLFSPKRFCEWIFTIVLILFSYCTRLHSTWNYTYPWVACLFSHDQAFRWSLSLNCHGGNIVLTHKWGFMLLILQCLCNTFIPTRNLSSNQGWMWSNNSWYQVHFGLSPQLGWSLARCGKCFQFDVKRGYIISKTLCNRWGHHIIYLFCLCILWFWISFIL